ncbi:MAG: hypothetical protein ACOYB8_09005 [Eubacteriaceae bacterium]|jgi:hypothetical protein
MKRKGVSVLIISALLLLLMCGCGKSSPIIGTWSSSKNTSDTDYDIRLVIKDDNTYSLHLKLSNAETSFDGDYTGTWVSDDKVITFTSQSMTTNSGDSTQGEIMNGETNFNYQISGSDLTLTPAQGQEGIPFSSLTLTKG